MLNSYEGTPQKSVPSCFYEYGSDRGRIFLSLNLNLNLNLTILLRLLLDPREERLGLGDGGSRLEASPGKILLAGRLVAA